MKIYISSTYLDLQEPRSRVAAELRKLGHDIIGMEDYYAENARPLERCLAEVDLADAVILLVAWRYGYVDPDTEPLRSITHHEFQRALDGGTPVLVLMLDPAAPWPGRMFDGVTKENDHGARILEFRQQVSRERLVSTWRSTDDLVTAAIVSVNQVGLEKGLVDETLDAVDSGTYRFSGDTGGLLDDSAPGSIIDAIRDAQQTEVVMIDLGVGQSWWNTRLFLLAGLLEDCAPVHQLVLLWRGEELLGLCSPDVLRRQLAAAYPTLEEFEQRIAAKAIDDDPTAEARRRVEDWMAWLTETDRVEVDVKKWVRRPSIRRWLGSYLVEQAIHVDPKTGLTVAQVDQILNWPFPYVPLFGLRPRRSDSPTTGPSLRVVPRDVFARQLAVTWARREMPRNPVR
jgi:hypothetical protein